MRAACRRAPHLPGRDRPGPQRGKGGGQPGETGRPAPGCGMAADAEGETGRDFCRSRWEVRCMDILFSQPPGRSSWTLGLCTRAHFEPCAIGKDVIASIVPRNLKDAELILAASEIISGVFFLPPRLKNCLLSSLAAMLTLSGRDTNLLPFNRDARMSRNSLRNSVRAGNSTEQDPNAITPPASHSGREN